MISSRPVRLVALSAFCLFLAGAVLAADAKPVKEPGDLWEVTSKVTMEGMPMAIPAQTHKVCAPKGSQEPAGVVDEERKCKATEMKTVGSKTSWKVQCEGPPPMSGEGEITRSSATAYAGFMKMSSPQGNVTVKLDGKRVGDCDASEQKRQIAAMQAQAEKNQQDAAAMTASMCKTSIVDGMNLQMLTMSGTTCSDPALKSQFCDRLTTVEGYSLLETCEAQPSPRLLEAATYCGKDPATLRSSLCQKELQKEDLSFVAKCCPAEAKGIAEKECAGRTYTSLGGSKYQNFCATYAMHTANTAETAPTEVKPESTTEKAKKTLKGLFKR